MLRLPLFGAPRLSLTTSLFVGGLLVSFARPGIAAEPPSPRSPTSFPYPAGTVLADLGVVAALVGLGVATKSADVTAIAAPALFLATAPAVHLAYGGVGPALSSLALRAALVGGLAGLASVTRPACRSGGESCGLAWAGLVAAGVAVGVPIVWAIDYYAIAKPAARRRAERLQMGLAPAPIPRGGGLSLVGRF
jgi:hypothetical protein